LDEFVKIPFPPIKEKPNCDFKFKREVVDEDDDFVWDEEEDEEKKDGISLINWLFFILKIFCWLDFHYR